MSRIGKKIINIPNGVEYQEEKEKIIIKGPKGQLEQIKHPAIIVTKIDNSLQCSIQNVKEQKERALWGLYQRLISNMIKGVSEGFSKKLEINGVGFRVVIQGKKLVLNVGFSHPVEYQIPEGIQIVAEKNEITVSGIDKQKVGQVAAEIRAIKKPEPYKGKGIKYKDEVIIRKAGKAAKSGS